MKIPRVMSTQHPDNVHAPFFADSQVLSGEDEIKEAFYAFSHLKISEQLWDFEGKEGDQHVVKKLLTRYEPYFKQKKLGADKFLTMRVPNPEVEKNEAKVLLETLETIPRSFDTAKLFYGEDIAPIFEIAVPMVTNAQVLTRIADYYKKVVVGKESTRIGNTTIGKWIGELNPKNIRIIPLIEDKESMLSADTIVEEFVTEQKIKDYQRVWLARSDPALNYSSLGCVLIEKIALWKLHHLSEKLSLEMYPILGCGSAPFRGNCKPTNVKSIVRGYPSVQTFTVQSVFKYDYDESTVFDGIAQFKEHPRKEPIQADEEALLPIIEKVGNAYQEQVQLLAPVINDFSKHIPSRRKRKLHIGLFGYSRSSGNVSLPRAITFCASLYSLGLPPELLGLHTLTGKDKDIISTVYPSYEKDIADATQFLNKENLDFFPKKIKDAVLLAAKSVPVEQDRKHQKITSIILEDYKKKNNVTLTENVCRAGTLRGFLG